MKKLVLVVLIGTVWMATPVGAQTPSAAPARPATAAPPAAVPPAVAAPPAQPATAKPPSVPFPAPTRVAAPRNVRFEITITDSGGPKPVTKTVALTLSDGGSNGSLRNVASLPGATPITTLSAEGPKQSGPGMFPLNLDVRNVVGYDDGSVRATVSVEYQPYAPDSKTQPGTITASATAVFQDGRRTQILQSTDPLSDRRTTIEVTATILK